MNKPNIILVVEDTPSHADLIIKILTHQGYSIIWQKTGLEALEYAKEHHPILFLIDIGLPDMSGDELMKKLRKICATHIPMIAITAHSMTDTKNILLSSGFDDYLSKPFRVNELVEVVKSYVPITNNSTGE
jgi:DNA-binding response OmpR family regulator